MHNCKNTSTSFANCIKVIVLFIIKANLLKLLHGPHIHKTVQKANKVLGIISCIFNIWILTLCMSVVY